jgi:hypothetical protein
MRDEETLVKWKAQPLKTYSPAPRSFKLSLQVANSSLRITIESRSTVQRSPTLRKFRGGEEFDGFRVQGCGPATNPKATERATQDRGTG